MLSQLANSANDAIDDATTDTTYVSGDNEPSLVARLVARLPDLLVDKWSNHFAAGDLHVTSAFCHPRPQAHWDSVHGFGPGRSELCDLLLLVASPDASGALTEHALLIQVKQGAQGQTSLSGDGDHTQRYMYAEWPDFHIASGRCKTIPSNCQITGKSLNIKAAAAMGTRYGIVAENENPAWHLESQFPTWSPTVKQGRLTMSTFDDIAALPISAQLSLGEALEMMVNKSLGHTVNNHLTPDWDEVVNILMINAMELQFKKKFHLVRHTPGAPLVPLSAACSLVTTIPSQAFLLRFIHPWEFSDHWARPRAKPSPSHAGGIIFSSPPGERVWENLEGGYGIIRIVVNGRFEEDAIRGSAPDERPKP